jgi:hypothetical protein
MDTTELNGFAYFSMRQGGPKEAPKSLPPPFLLRFILRMTDKRSIKAAERFWKEEAWKDFSDTEYPRRKKEWKQQMDEWTNKLEGVEALSSEQLAGLMEKAQAWGGKMYAEHAQVTMVGLSLCYSPFIHFDLADAVMLL